MRKDPKVRLASLRCSLGTGKVLSFTLAPAEWDGTNGNNVAPRRGAVQPGELVTMESRLHNFPQGRERDY